MAASTKPSRKTAFVISPIGSPGTPEHRRYQLALEFIVRKALPPDAWEVIRADDEESPDSIGAKVIERILRSDLIVANLTDLNPNVFYELAVAHGFRRPVVHMMELGQKIPFDVSDQRAIFYDLADPESVHNATTRLASSASYLEDADAEARNPLSQFAAFEAISSATSPGEAGSAVAEALQDLSLQVARLARRVDELEPARRTYGGVGLSDPYSLFERERSDAERARSAALHDRAGANFERLAEIEAEITNLQALEAEADAQQVIRLARLRAEAAQVRTLIAASRNGAIHGGRSPRDSALTASGGPSKG